MKKLYYAGYTLEKEKSFCELVEAIKQNESIKIKDIASLVEVIEMEYISPFNGDRKETGSTHIGYDFQYLTIEYKNNYYYIQHERFANFEVTGYMKVSPTTKQQATYSTPFKDYNELLAHIEIEKQYIRPLAKTNTQKLYLLTLSSVKNVSGFRENEILKNLDDVYTSQHDKSAHVLTFVSINGDSFDFEVNSNRITG